MCGYNAFIAYVRLGRNECASAFELSIGLLIFTLIYVAGRECGVLGVLFTGGYNDRDAKGEIEAFEPVPFRTE
jgi:hypothetical protein